MKALEILKAIKYPVFSTYEKYGGFCEKDYEEAIAELEALLEPKSCDGCKYHVDSDVDGWGVCINIGSWLYIEETPAHATCVYHESKEQQ